VITVRSNVDLPDPGLPTMAPWPVEKSTRSSS
jgi:hypothetical protein